MDFYHNVLAYWRTSCTDSDRMAPSEAKLEAAPKVTIEQVQAGSILPDLMPRIKALLTADGKQKTRQLSDVSRDIDVLIAPLAFRARLRGTYSKNGRPALIRPLWIPAMLHSDGTLLPPSRSLPWIDRQLLEPVGGGHILLGHTEVVDSFLTQHQRPASEEGWARYWDYCSALFRAVTGSTLSVFQMEGYETALGCILPFDPQSGSRKAIISVYDSLSDKQIPTLLKRFSSGSPTELSTWLSESAQRGQACNHTGQMANAFPLSPSQRESLHHVLHAPNGDILAVNGPPGTGKTTLIQSIVATLWVNAAIEGGEPPVIVAASTNNQAVQNVITSFGLATNEKGRTIERWLPDIVSFGLYCVSQAKVPEVKASKLQFVVPNSRDNQTGFFAALETPEYLTRATTTFLNHVGQHFSATLSLTQAAQSLRQQMQDVVAKMREAQELFNEILDLRELIARKRVPGAPSSLEKLQWRLQEVEQERQQHPAVHKSWRKLTKSDGLLRTLFDYLPSVKRNLAKRNTTFFEQHKVVVDEPVGTYREVEAFLCKRAVALDGAIVELEHAIKQEGVHERRLAELEPRWLDWSAMYQMQEATDTFADHLDITLRFEAFELASHYWEARWLLEMQQRLSTDERQNASKHQLKQQWHRYAKLTPCFVSTLFMVPRFFSAWEQNQSTPLFNYIDLLIIDEAGQVSPEIAGASFALAKKAIVVGDTKQIEPVWAIPPVVDKGNLRHHGLAASQEQVNNVHASGISASSGSVMVVAQRASRYQQGYGPRGMFLTEHRRCVPEIITYCNELAYAGRLQPLRASEPQRLYPPMGYAHIPGQCERHNGSRRNVREAKVIAEWIAEQQEELRIHYKQKPLDALIAVVTPFTAQAQCIKEALSRYKISNITIGTVHALQGAERPVVLFSPVYSDNEGGTFFFDRNVNMLNVAVSRAKDSFLVFGNMSIFEPFAQESTNRPTPSALLARYLFAQAENELSVIDLVGRRATEETQTSTQRITSLEEHRRVLTDAINNARQRVTIVSPFISIQAINEDHIAELIANAVKRGVIVEVYTDEQLNVAGNQRIKPEAQAGYNSLLNAGAHLHVVQRIHNKTLCVDDCQLYEGSFNWLSAVRKAGRPYQRHEVSFGYNGPDVAVMIAEALREMEEKTNKVLGANTSYQAAVAIVGESSS